MDELKRVMHDYHLATGIPCWYLSCLREDGVHHEPAGCSFCSLPKSCEKIHLFATYQSERFGGKYLYLCPLSLLHWASPVSRSGMLQGALISGPALLFEADTYFIDQLTRTYDRPDEVVSRLDEIVTVTPHRSESLANILMLSALSLSDAEARALYADRELFTQQSRISEYLHGLKSMESDKRSDIEYPLETEKKLMILISQGNRREAGILLDELLGILLYTSGADLEMITSRVLELVVLLSRSAVEAGADAEEIFGINFHYIRKVREIDTLEDLARWTRRILDRFTDLVFVLKNVRHTQKIIRARSFIQKHFQEKISLQDIADHVSLSIPYLSTMFKQETGTSVTEYITGLRIDEARKMLVQTVQPLGDISLACGFEDQSYFSKVFKRVTGILPSRYRETGGRIIPLDRATQR